MNEKKIIDALSALAAIPLEGFSNLRDQDASHEIHSWIVDRTRPVSLTVGDVMAARDALKELIGQPKEEARVGIRLPSAEEGEEAITAFAPKGMGQKEALDFVNGIIVQANHEDHESPHGETSLGSVETYIRTHLENAGFLMTPVDAPMSLAWDQYHGKPQKKQRKAP